jgi:hypothetical protein
MVSFRSSRHVRGRDRADRGADMLRGAAIGVLVVGVVASGLLARGWQSTVTRQREERLDRAAATPRPDRPLPRAPGHRLAVSGHPPELPAFLARTRADGEPGFTIRPPAAAPCTT